MLDVCGFQSNPFDCAKVGLPASCQSPDCRGKSEEEKQKLLMQLITKAGQMHTMQGRMNSMVHGTLRTVGDEQSRFQNASVGYHLKRDKP